MHNIPQVERERGEFFIRGDLYVPNISKQLRTAWLRRHRLYVGAITGPTINAPRVFVPVRSGIKLRMMDAITGSLYDVRSGRCLSSDLLSAKWFGESEKKATAILSAINPEKFGD